MKSTDNFKKTIENHLFQQAEKDALFAETLKKPNKNIDDCINYILNTVQASGCNGFADEEIFKMAVHFYDEDDLKAGKPISCNVVVNHSVVLTEEEKAAAKKEAFDLVVNGEKNQLLSQGVKKVEKKKEVKQVVEQSSLF